MAQNSVFNLTICLMGIMILLVHVANIMIQKETRWEEKILLYFFIFTIIHFATYLTFTLLKDTHQTNAFIIAFYTIFYIMNNIEVLLLFWYARNYIKLDTQTGKALSIVNISLFSLFVLLDIINIFTGIFFTAQDGIYQRSKTMIISQGYQFIMFGIIIVIALKNKKLYVREKVAFCVYCILPLVAIVLQNIFKGYAIAYASIIVSIEILFLFLSVQNSIELARVEEKNKDAKVKLMLSQIQPHFMYNSLSAISTLIPIDPNKAQDALDRFTAYLRANLSSLSAEKLIPFEDELKHIETYVALEKLRFNDRVNAVYDIQTKDFKVPPLTIQPLVENAIKHGVLKKLEGGTVTLRTLEVSEAYIVEIIDDGVGFNMADVDFSSNIHFGLNNIRYRLNTMCRADVVVESEVGKGTKIRVIFYK